MTTGWTQINAYVDGELDAVAAAEVAAAIARDPQLAARVATLSKLKATAAAMPGPATSPAPAFVRTVLDTARRPHAQFVRRAALAASVLMMLGAAGTWLAWPRLNNPVETAWTDDELDNAVAAHGAWIGGAKTKAASDRIQIALEARELVRVPDLSTAQLSLAYVSLNAERSASGGILLGYVGPNGCRLGLWIADAGHRGFGTELRHVSRGGTGVHIWQNGTTNYAVLGRGMDPERLSALAAIVRAIVDRDHKLDDALRAELQTAAGQGTRCPA